MQGQMDRTPLRSTMYPQVMWAEFLGFGSMTTLPGGEAARPKPPLGFVTRAQSVVSDRGADDALPDWLLRGDL